MILKVRWIAFLSLLLIGHYALAEISVNDTANNWSQVLATYQNQSGLFNYKKLKSDLTNHQAKKFEHIVDQIQTVSLAEYNKWTLDEQKAFLINAYNILTVKLIVDNYPVKSIKKIGGFFTKPWKIEFFNLLSGKIKYLDAIEHEWLRPTFKDFRVHAAVNCASISCPPLRHDAYVAEKLNAQLDEQMKVWINDGSRNDLKPESSAISVSKIFDWYKEDFEKWGGGVLTVLNKYKEQPFMAVQLSNLKLKYLEYNWDLNEAK